MSLTNDNPYGYGAKTAEELQRYLERVFASPEQLYAATTITQLRSKIDALQQELKALHQKPSLVVTDHSPKLRKQLHDLSCQYEHDRAEDLERIEYCLRNDVLLADTCIFVRLEQEEVIDGDYRSALDKLMQL